MRVDIPVVLRLLFRASLLFAVEEDCTGGLIIEVFNYSYKVGADVVLLHGCPQSCMPNPVEGLLEVCEDMVEVSPVLEVFLADNSSRKLQVPGLSCILRGFQS